MPSEEEKDRIKAFLSSPRKSSPAMRKEAAAKKLRDASSKGENKKGSLAERINFGGRNE